MQAKLGKGKAGCCLQGGVLLLSRAGLLVYLVVGGVTVLGCGKGIIGESILEYYDKCWLYKNIYNHQNMMNRRELFDLKDYTMFYGMDYWE